jgi:hypothetical protein
MTLIAHWNASNNTIDSVGGRNAEWVGTPSYGSGDQGFSTSAGNYLKVTDTTIFQFLQTDNFSVEFSIKPTSIIDDYQSIIIKGDDSYGWAWGVWTKNGELFVKASGGENLFTIGAGLLAGNTYAIVYNYDNGVQTISIDGVPQTLNIVAFPEPNYISEGVGYLYFGVYADESSYPFTGIIDDIKIYIPTISTERFWVSSIARSFNSSYWSTTPGGEPGASVPSSSNFVTYDRYSGSCLIDSTISISSLILNSDYTNTITYDASIFLTNLTLAGGYLTTSSDSSIAVSGDVSCLSGFGDYSSANNAVIVMDSSNPQFITGGGIFPSLVINNSSAHVKLLGPKLFHLNGDIIIQDGTFNTNGRDIDLFGSDMSSSPVDTPISWWPGDGDTTDIMPLANNAGWRQYIDGIGYDQPYDGTYEDDSFKLENII